MDPGQLEIQGASPDVLVIGPGIQEIPPEGWGAVELICDWHRNYLNRNGFDVDLLNSRRLGLWLAAFKRKPRVVLLHYDAWARRAYVFGLLFRVRVAVVTHYAYAGDEQRWDRHYNKVFSWLRRLDGLVALNPRIAEVFVSKGFRGLVLKTRNFIPVGEFEQASTRKGFLILGKVEARKRQIDVAKNLEPKLLSKFTFVGPIHDHRYDSLPSDIKKQFVGEWSRAAVEANLGGFAGLVLASDGEADALVLYEAQAAGLPILISREARGSQDESLPWVRVFRDLEELSVLCDLFGFDCEENIARYALENYDMEIGIGALISFLRALSRRK